MKRLVAIGTFVAGASVGFITCGALTVRGVLGSEKLRGAIVNAIAEKVEDWLYEDTKYRPRTKVSYTDYYYYTRVNDNNNAYIHEHVFETRGDAERVLEEIGDAIAEYGYVSVQDLYELCGESGSHIDRKLGWKSAADMKIVKVRAGYIIKFPAVEKID